MKKLYLALYSFIAILIIALVICFMCMSSIVGSILTSTFGVKTTVNATAITTNKIRFWQLKISNPKVAKTPYALTIGKIGIKAPITTYLSNDIEIKKITLDNLLLTIEILPGKGNLSNWDDIISHMSSPSPSASKSQKDTTIKELTITNIKIKIIDASGVEKINTIKSLTFKDLSTKNGDITSKIAKVIIMRMLFDVKNITNFPLKINNQNLNDFLKPIGNDIKIIIPTGK